MTAQQALRDQRRAHGKSGRQPGPEQRRRRPAQFIKTLLQDGLVNHGPARRLSLLGLPCDLFALLAHFKIPQKPFDLSRSGAPGEAIAWGVLSPPSSSYSDAPQALFGVACESKNTVFPAVEDSLRNPTFFYE